MTILRLSLVAAAAAGLSACSPPAADTSGVVAAIKADEAQWNADYKAKDIDKLAGHYAPDAELFVPGAPRARSPTDARKILAGVVSDPALSMNFASDKIEVAKSGDLAYASGHYRITQTDPKTKQVMAETGGYVTVYRKQPDGGWKAAEDIAAADGPQTPVK